MEWLQPYLPEIWLAHMGFFLLYYAVSDGLDLGIGILCLFYRSPERRSLLMGSIRSNWHGNQTWLVILAGMLFGAFPLFYAVVFSALYIPLLAMLFGLIFRGVAFEFRDHSERRRVWEAAFAWGSLLTAAAQGFAFGAILSGRITVQDGRFSGGPFDWLDPYAALVTVGVLVGYTMLGSNYLILKTEGPVQRSGYRIAWGTSLATLAIAVAVHVWTIYRFDHVAARWSRTPEAFFIGGTAALAAVAYILMLVGLKRRQTAAPLFFNATVVVLSFGATSLALYPEMIPSVSGPGLTVQEAAAAPQALMFMLYVSMVALPVIVTYTSYEYWVFRGKTKEGT